MTGYDVAPMGERHRPWVLDSFAKSLRWQWPWSLVGTGHLVDDFKRELATARVLVATAPGDPDAFVGWAATHPERNEVVFAFTKYALRRMSVASGLVLETGVDLTQPTAVRYWSAAAARIAQRPGYRLAWVSPAHEAGRRDTPALHV